MGLDKDAALKKIQDSEKLEFEVFEGGEHETFLENFNEGFIKIVSNKVVLIYMIEIGIFLCIYISAQKQENTDYSEIL